VPGLFSFKWLQLGSAALTQVVVFFVLTLAALFLGILLAALLAALAGLAALLTGLAGLSALLAVLTALSTLLFIFLHIVCHE
jgi:hypothetical protein